MSYPTAALGQPATSSLTCPSHASRQSFRRSSTPRDGAPSPRHTILAELRGRHLAVAVASSLQSPGPRSRARMSTTNTPASRASRSFAFPTLRRTGTPSPPLPLAPPPLLARRATPPPRLDLNRTHQHLQLASLVLLGPISSAVAHRSADSAILLHR